MKSRELEALLIIAAKATSYGVIGVNPKRAAEFGVPVGAFVKAGDKIPGCTRKAPRSGYFCPRSSPIGVPAACLAIDANSPGDGWTRYRLAVLSETGTGEADFQGRSMSLTLAEMKVYLRGIADGAGSR